MKKAMNVAIIIHQNEDLATSKYEDSMFAKEKSEHKIWLNAQKVKLLGITAYS